MIKEWFDADGDSFKTNSDRDYGEGRRFDFYEYPRDGISLDPETARALAADLLAFADSQPESGG